MTKEEIIELIESDGLEELFKWFGSEKATFNFLKKHNLWDHVDVMDSHIQNRFLLWAYENEPQVYRKWVSKLLDDVEFDDTGKPYLVRSNRGDLSILFCDSSRYDLSRDTVEKILDQDGDVYEPYWDTTDNVYRDVIEELDEKNINNLKRYMLNTLKDKQISPETEEMELIAAEQGHEEFWFLTEENVTRIIDDEESMNSLLNDELSDLKSELYSVHNNSYNSAYESSVWYEIWKELNEYFDGQGEFVYKKHPYKENTTIENFKIPISDLDDIILGFLNQNKDYGGNDTLEYWGSFLSVVSEIEDCLSARIPDYPDFREVDKNINLYFSDYI